MISTNGIYVWQIHQL
jgi:hypothetical protein